MKMTNGDIGATLADMTQATSGGNRLPAVPGLRASRIRDRLAKAWEPCDEMRLQLCRDHGKVNEAGTAYSFEGADALNAFNAAWKAVCEEERELEVETLTLAELEAGWIRTQDGKKEYPKAGEIGIDLSPEQIGRLVRVGIVTVPAD